MAFSLKVTQGSDLIKKLSRRNSRFRKLAHAKFIIASDAFLEKTIEEHYTGRKSDNTGLNQDTTDLWGKWLSKVRDLGDNVSARISTTVKYASVHEFGSSKKNIPKRSDVTGDMESGFGRRLFVEAGKKALKEAY